MDDKKNRSSSLASDGQVALAFDYSARAHFNKFYPDGKRRTPHFSHCAKVALDVANFCASEKAYSRYDPEFATIVAVLHDVMEDCRVKKNDLLREFGPLIANSVFALSRDPNLRRDRQMERSLELILKLNRPEVSLVKIADRNDNLMRAIIWANIEAPVTWEPRYLDESRLILERLGGIGGPAPKLLNDRIVSCQRLLALRPKRSRRLLN